MGIDQFPNPEEEQVHDDQYVWSRFTSEDGEQEVEDNACVLPRISASEALESLYKLQLQEQQVDANKDLIRLLQRHKRVALERKHGKQQLSIRHDVTT